MFRSEGHAGCSFGKALVAEVTGTAYTDTAVANDRAYAYNVVAVGVVVLLRSRRRVPHRDPGRDGGPDFSLACSPASVSALQGGSAATTCTVTSFDGFVDPWTCLRERARGRDLLLRERTRSRRPRKAAAAS